MFMFHLKKLISPIFYPLTLCLILMTVGLFLQWFTKRQKTGKIIISMGVIFLTLFSFEPLADRILAPLEQSYPALTTIQTRVKWIVVLGGGHTSDPRLPVTSQISCEALARLTEALRLYRSRPEAKLILSGGAVFDPVSEAEIYFRIARIMGVPVSNLVLSDRARDTEEEARFIREIVGTDQIILVTSALHMPRAIALFKKQGMHPIPAPSSHLVKHRSEFTPEAFRPSAEALWKVQLAVHEYLGMVWSKLRNRI